MNTSNTSKIHYGRLITAFFITFVVVDTCPHPNAPPGFIQSAISHIQQNVLSK